MLRMTAPFAGTFIVEGGTTENSMGLVVKGLGVTPPLGAVLFSALSLLDELLSLSFEGI